MPTSTDTRVSAPLVSVVIPCYNHAAFIEETLNSVLRSEYPALEILVVDDGSSDRSREVVENVMQRDARINYLYQDNAGPSVARNHGIRRAQGIYILPLDADDLISPKYIDDAVAVFQARPEVKVVYCEAEKFGEKTGAWKLKPFSRRLLARDNMIFVSALYRKSDWEAIGGYSEDMVWGREDWEFWIKLLKNGGEVVKLPEVGFYYRIRSTSRRKGMNPERKRKIIDYINTHHRTFIWEQLDGPLHYQRTHSRLLNRISRILGLLED